MSGGIGKRVTKSFQQFLWRVHKRQDAVRGSWLGFRKCSPFTTNAALGLECLEDRLPLAADFLSFDIVDASGDDTAQTVFESSALSLNYDIDVTSGSLLSVDVFAKENNSLFKLGEYTSDNLTDQLVNLDGYTTLAGTQEIFAIAHTSDGESTFSSLAFLEVLPTTSVFGDYTAEKFFFTGSPGSASVFYGSGGTDTLSLGIDESLIASFNGSALSSYVANSMVTTQTIYDGSAFDYLRLNDGREIYFQGIELLSFNGGAVTELQTTTNDPRFSQQWNLSIGDVPDAWRFTRGSDEVLLVSLDTGIPTSGGNQTFSDLDSSRLSFSGNANGSDHGHQAVSVIAATPNNNEGIAGINWESPVLVFDVYGPENVGLNTAITTALNRLNSTSETRVVFQGGVQGEFWLNTLQQSLIANNQDKALFAVAAGNGGQDISLTSHPEGLSGGIARLEGTYENVLAIGALRHSFDFAGGLENAGSVFLASYSNFGPNLTFAVPTDVPAQRPDGSNGNFNGTSAANPVAAGYASLVWSANPDLTGGEVRQILADTVTDLGASGRDNTYGHGVPNAGAAVRRSWALAEHPELAGIDTNPFSLTRIVDLDALSYQYDLGTNASPVANGYEDITPGTLGDISWSVPVSAADHNTTQLSSFANIGFESSTGGGNFPQANDWTGDARVASHSGFGPGSSGNLGDWFAFNQGSNAPASQTLPDVFEAGTSYQFQSFVVNNNDNPDIVYTIGYLDGNFTFQPLADQLYDLSGVSDWTQLDGVTHTVQTGGPEVGRQVVVRINSTIDQGVWFDNVSLSQIASANDVNRDFVFSSQTTTLDHEIANGVWDITITSGDANAAHDNLSVKAEGVVKISDLDTAAGEYAEETFRVLVSDGTLSLEFSDLGGTTSDWVLNHVSLEKVSGIGGDFNFDSSIDGQDLAQWQSNYGVNGEADVDGDGDSDGADFLSWQRNFSAPLELSSALGSEPLNNVAATTDTRYVEEIGYSGLPRLPIIDEGETSFATTATPTSSVLAGFGQLVALSQPTEEFQHVDGAFYEENEKVLSEVKLTATHLVADDLEILAIAAVELAEEGPSESDRLAVESVLDSLELAFDSIA